MKKYNRFPVAQAKYKSFDGQVEIKGKRSCPDRYSFWNHLDDNGNYIPRGSGLSYSAASFGNDCLTVEHLMFNRVLSLDIENNIIEVEAGIRLGDLFEILTPLGLCLAIQPGYPGISIGGCIAAEVHGKNQWKDGNFSNQVQDLRLFHPSYGFQDISRNQQPDLFRLTCGGFGLTGNIISAKLKLAKIEGNIIKSQISKINLTENFQYELSLASNSSDYVYTWHDFSKKDAGFGEGFLHQNTHQLLSESELSFDLNNLYNHGYLNSYTRDNWRLCFFNQYTLAVFNRLYKFNCERNAVSYLSLYNSFFPITQNKAFYFKLFGKAGFHEYQAVIPCESFLDYINMIKKKLEKMRVPITLASAKLFGGHRELLRFTGEGVCFALNFPKSSISYELLSFLDNILVECKGIPNIIKDSRIQKRAIEQTYQGYEEFRDVLDSYDPKRLYKSELSERIGV